MVVVNGEEIRRRLRGLDDGVAGEGWSEREEQWLVGGGGGGKRK